MTEVVRAQSANPELQSAPGRDVQPPGYSFETVVPP